MCKLCFYGSVMAALLLFSLPCLATNVQADLDVEIIHPLALNYGELKQFCEDEPQVIFCEELKEKLKDSDDWFEYSVLTGNYQ